MGGNKDDGRMINMIAGFLSGLLGAMGLGGGGILILYLTLFLSTEQLEAQGINLLFFLPCAVISIIRQCVKKLIDWKTVIRLIVGGIVGVGIGIWIANVIKTDLLSKIFAVFLLIMGTYELFSKKEVTK